MERKTKVVIIGSGPAGITAAIYLKRALIDFILLDKYTPGGKVNLTGEIENYPGFSKVTGPDLAFKFFEQLQAMDIQIDYGDIRTVEYLNPGFKVVSDEETIYADYVIAASGTKERLLNVPGEERLTGHGVSYCAVCDGNLFKGQVVAVVGGGNSALQEALYLSTLTKKVYVIHRRQGFRAENRLVERARKTPNIEFILDAIPTEIVGDLQVEGITIENKFTNVQSTLAVNGIFPFIGMNPNTGFLKHFPILNEQGFLLVHENMMTDIDGLYGAGDINHKELRQIVTATNDGAIAAIDISHRVQ